MSGGQKLALGGTVAVAVVAGVLNYTEADEVLVFVVAGLALAGLAWLVSFATEQVGARFGPAITGFLQSTLGNLPAPGRSSSPRRRSSDRCSPTRCW